MRIICFLDASSAVQYSRRIAKMRQKTHARNKVKRFKETITAEIQGKSPHVYMKPIQLVAGEGQ